MSTAATASSSSNALNPPAAQTARPLKMSTTGKVLDAQRKPGSPVDGGQRCTRPGLAFGPRFVSSLDTTRARSLEFRGATKPPQKAWTQGTNPITQRPSNPPASNGATTAPKPSPNSTASPGEAGVPMRHLSDRMMYLLANLTGLPGTITLKNGEKYSGVLSGTSLDPSELRYVFKMVKKLLPAANAQTNGTGDISDDYVGVGDYHVMSFDMSDVADFNVNNVVLDKSQTKGQNGTAGFRTDTDISGNMAIRERNLQKWEPTEIDPNLTLESSGRSSEWDQFSTNERLFGVKSNYDETYYTTTINRSDPQYAQKAARAEKLAREIEASSALNSHVREERGGHAPADDGGDEEDKYSGVRRDYSQVSSGPSKYTPPARRAPAPQATVPGAPVDPAIISSSVARPDAVPKATTQRTASPAAEKAPATEPAKVDVDVPKGPAASNPLDILKDSATKAEVKSAAAAKPTPDASQKPSSTIKPTVAAIPPRKTGRPHDATTNVEHDLLDSFKQFSAAEKLRMSERQRTIARENKAVKLNDLKKFALNFKLSTPVPSDLVPILAKDETKQQAIVEKALKQAQETKTTPPKPASTLVDVKATARPAPTKPDSTHASPSAGQPNQRPRPGQPPYASASMRERSQQNFNQIPPRGQGPLSTRLQLSHQQHKQQSGLPYNNIPQPIPAQDMRAPPTGPSNPSSGIQTPTSTVSTRFNVRANEFKPNPAANTFQPLGNPSTNSSPRPTSATKPEPRKPLAITSFFGGQRPPAKQAETKENFNAIARMQKEAQAQVTTKTHSDFPPPFRTPPTWDFPTANAEKTHVQMFEHATAPCLSRHPMHQLPPHLHGPQPGNQGQNSHHTPRGPPVQPHHGQAPHHYGGEHMQFSHSTSSVHPSPRPMPPYVYGQQPQPMPGYPQQVQMPQYGMSPGVQHVGLRNAQPGQFISPPPAIGGHMMTNQPSNGPFMGMPGNPQMQMYSPAPGPAYPQYPGHMPGGPGTNGAFPNSPRPGAPMMSHQGSQQGHQQPPMMYMQAGAQGPQMFQVPPGSMTPMRGPYPQPHQPHYGSPHQHHQFPHQHRGTPSGSYSQPMMQQHSIPGQGPPTGPVNHGPDGSDEPK
ncbi:PAB1 binding protein-like protein [Paraphoma chrysanthemicola]|nr:PAB1 binding protein-like protein [Paraphoma chrysanthemicola]